MATKSGITAAESLILAFKSLDKPVLAIKINDDSSQLIEDLTVPQPTSDSLDDVFASLHSHFEKQYPSPGYAVFPREGGHAFVSFIPDSAPIRTKMLYASTKNTIIQELGSSHFGNRYVLALTELEELSKHHYDHVTAASNDTAVYSASERTLQEVNQLEKLTLSQASTSKELPSMHGSQLLFKVEAHVREELEGDLLGSLVLLNLNTTSETVHLLEKIPDVSDVVAAVSSSKAPATGGPFYAIYGYAAGKLAFIYLCPSGSKVRDRMLYAANKQGFLAYLKSSLDGTVEHVLEVGDIDELEVSVFDNKPAEAARTQRITRPKGPRRR